MYENKWCNIINILQSSYSNIQLVYNILTYDYFEIQMNYFSISLFNNFLLTTNSLSPAGVPSTNVRFTPVIRREEQLPREGNPDAVTLKICFTNCLRNNRDIWKVLICIYFVCSTTLLLAHSLLLISIWPSFKNVKCPW